jgi:enhancer of mRNA-decapping protein 3
MADFTGATVKVTLKQPPNTVLHGRVREVAAGSLALEDVFFPNTGARWPQWTVQGAAIADIEVIGKDEEQSAPPQMPPMHHQQQQQQHHMPSMQQHMPMQRSMHPGQMPMPMHMQQHPNTGFAPPPMPMPMPMHMQQGPPSAMMAHPPPVPIHMQRPPSASMSPAPMPTTTRPSSGATQRAPSVPNPQHPSASVTPSPMPAQAQDSAPSANQIQLPFPTAQGMPTPQKQSATFVDPAIMSIGRSPAQQRTATPNAGISSPATPIKSAMAKAAEALPVQPTSPYVADPIKFNLPAKPSNTRPKQVPEVALPQQVPPPQQQAAGAVGVEESAAGEDDAGQPDTNSKTKRGRRGIRNNRNKVAGQSQEVPPPAVMNVEVSRNGNDMNGTVKRGKGWRQTPLLQPSPQPGSSPSKNGKMTRRQREEHREGKNGWATEEATDIQDLGDFDFEASNTLFDKKTVFDELRQGDTTADEDRLVGHNRIARPGTYGGKNLHPSENVLSPKLPVEEASSDADTEMNFHTGRSSSRHSATKPSRQNSTVVDSRHPLAASMSSERGLSRSAISLVGRNGKSLPVRANASPRPDRLQSPHSVVSSKAAASPRPPMPSQGPHLALQHSNAQCPVLLPAALETLEAETTTRYGLTQDAITELAARSIAELAMSMIDPVEPTSRRGSRTHATRAHITANSSPVVVVLAGNHAAGARAVAAARHLTPRHAKIILAEAQYESAATQEEQMVKQTLMLKRMARAGADIKRGTWRKASSHIKNLSGPPAIIIDALLAGTTYDSLLSPNAAHSEAAQRETREMIDWANRSRAPVLSIACPSGVGGQDGSSTILDGEPLAVRPDRVLALGAPMVGVLEAMKNGESWEVDLADIGINIALKIEEAVAFSGVWVDGLRFVEE